MKNTKILAISLLAIIAASNSAQAGFSVGIAGGMNFSKASEIEMSKQPGDLTRQEIIAPSGDGQNINAGPAKDEKVKAPAGTVEDQIPLTVAQQQEKEEADQAAAKEAADRVEAARLLKLEEDKRLQVQPNPEVQQMIEEFNNKSPAEQQVMLAEITHLNDLSEQQKIEIEEEVEAQREAIRALVGINPIDN